MTVRELIQALQKENQDAEVLVEDWSEGYVDPSPVKIGSYVCGRLILTVGN